VDANITSLTYRDSKLPRKIADADAVVLGRDEYRNYHIVVVYDGPQYPDCRAEHAKVTARR
jgi:hypothetical protein